MTPSACQGVWLRRLLEDMGHVQVDATPIQCDNQSAIAISKNPALHGKTKHIDIRYHFIRNLISEGLEVLTYCNTEEQAADILSKPLPLKKHIYFRSLIGVCNFSIKGVC